ncbi:putative nicotinamide mononucleotide permease protein [Phaeoacremonium minimum UCRPA7]|uniref:Putative nicotinamide mononucleotide permease protein n=1 Tax=Phaeoacremonium minimum (strain UCR-PA7) TaxID=1286976 RepID=R8BLE1_PHAM7|nr:putative nicotinamide mononucleotide permease protein [Phaeoacremonium minimum UCRPA7]EOO00178.1 putative nicotinamide mononucleotide permease protein [Phaeoacremonium minimum UCRPA7]
MSEPGEKHVDAVQRVEHTSTAALSVKSNDSHVNDKSADAADAAQAQQIAAQWVDGTPEEKRLKRKLDWRILPCTWVLYLLGYLDRANIGNAKTGGLQSDFGLTSSQYSIIVLAFFISYLVFEVPANMILTRVRPSVFLPGLGLVWGTFAALMGATQNWSQVAGLRFLLGFAEAGFAPGCAFFLSSWYRKYELATRYAFLYTSVPIAGAISGLLAGVITDHMDGAGGLSGWRWLFILEGLASVVASVIIFFLMPDYPSNSKRFLNEEESILACNRLAADGIGLTQGRGVEHIPHWTAFKMTCVDWRVWAQCLLFVLVTGSQTMQYFIPTLVKSFGWTGPVGQYHTIPAYMAALVYVVACCWLADKYKAKWQFICGLSAVGCVLFIAVTALQDKMAQYVLTIFAFGTIYGCSPLVKTWVSDVIPQPAAKRAIAIALINAIGNASSIYSSWLWPDKDAPRYIPGFATTTTWLGVLCICTAIFAYFFKKYPIERKDHAEVIAAELRARREGRQPDENI